MMDLAEAQAARMAPAAAAAAFQQRVEELEAQLHRRRCFQDGLLVIQLALNCVHDAPTLARVAVVSTGCSSLVEGHCQQYAADCVSTELQRQRQLKRMQSSKPSPQAQAHVVQMEPLEWVCKLAGRNNMSKHEVARAVVFALPSLSTSLAVLHAALKPLALAGLQLDDELLLEAAQQRVPHVNVLAYELFMHSLLEKTHNMSGTSLSSICAGLVLDCPDWIVTFKQQLAVDKLPGLLQIACCYSRAATLQKLVETAVDRLAEKMPGPGSSSRGPSLQQHPLVATTFQLIRDCVEHHDADTMRALTLLPAAHCLGAKEVLSLLGTVLSSWRQRCWFVNANPEMSSQIRCLTTLQGAKDISAADLTSIFLESGEAPVKSKTLRPLLQLPAAASASTLQLLQMAAAVAGCADKLNQEDPDDDDCELLADLDSLLMRRGGVTRTHVKVLLQDLMPAEYAVQNVLVMLPSGAQLSLLQAGDVESLVHQAIRCPCRNFAAARLLLTGAPSATELTPSTLVNLFEATMTQMRSVNDWSDGHDRPTNVQRVQEVLDALLALPAAAQLSSADADVLLTCVVDKELPTAATWLRSVCPAVEAAWAQIDPLRLADFMLAVLSDDGPGKTEAPLLQDALAHRQLQHMPADQLAAVITCSFSARQRATQILKQHHDTTGTAPQQPEAAAPAAPDAQAQAGAGAGAAGKVTAEQLLETAAATDILDIKISTAALSKLLQLPGIAAVPSSTLQSWVEMSVALNGDCLEALLSAPAGQAVARDFLVQQLTQEPGAPSLLERALTMPESSPLMLHLTPDLLRDLIELCMRHNHLRETLQLLVSLPGAQVLTEAEVDGLLCQAQPPLLIWRDYQDVLMQLPNAGACVVGECYTPAAAAAADAAAAAAAAAQQQQQPEGGSGVDEPDDGMVSMAADDSGFVSSAAARTVQPSPVRPAAPKVVKRMSLLRCGRYPTEEEEEEPEETEAKRPKQ